MSHAKCICAECENTRYAARRYNWLRANGSHLIVGWLYRPGDGLGDISPERMDFLVDRARTPSMAKSSAGSAEQEQKM